MRCFFMILIVLLCCPQGFPQENSAKQTSSNSSVTDLEQDVERVITRYMRNVGIPGLSVAIGRNNEIIFAKAFGLIDVENQVPTTVTSRFRTASIAKPLTATVILRLAATSKLSLDAEVQNYCPEYPKKEWPLTVRQVLGHLGGVRHYVSNEEPYSTSHFFSVKSALVTFADDPLLHEPGTKYLYSTFGYNLLGAVAENATGERFMQLLQRDVIDPAGMTHTVADDSMAVISGRAAGYFRPNASMLDRFPKGHSLVAGELYNARLHDTSMKIPGGGLLSTPTDLVRFAIALQSEKILSREQLQEMWTPMHTRSGEATGYGLGWQVGEQRNQASVWHTGGQSGTSTVLMLFPQSRISVAIMSNLEGVPLVGIANSMVASLVSTPSANPK